MDRGFDRILNFMECFLRKDINELTLTELSEQLGLPKATTSRIAEKLEQRGYLLRSPENRCYRLGPKFLPLGQKFLDNLDFRSIALPHMERLGQEIDETVSLFVVARNQRVCVARVRSMQALQRVISVGDELPLNRGASGRILRAFAPDFTGLGQEDSKELQEVRKQGYAVSHGERASGISSVSAPIKDYQGRIIAALTISGPSFRYSEEKMVNYIEKIRRTAAGISHELGYEDGSGHTYKLDGVRNIVSRN